jgi:Fe-Mn family superoxide dismutase
MKEKVRRKEMAHKLPKLPYEFSALEPHIDTRTMAIHHDKHHQAYVNNLNQALEGYEELQKASTIQLLMDLDAVPEEIRTAVRNNGGGHFCHSLFWRCMSPGGGGEPSGGLAEAIEAGFGSFAAFQDAFTKAAATLFGSGWAWLCVDGEGELAITTTPGHDVPLYEGLLPLLVLDVWEHAYYLKFENRRADYIAAWWNVVDWQTAAAGLTTAKLELGLAKAVGWAAGAWTSLEKEWAKLFES